MIRTTLFAAAAALAIASPAFAEGMEGMAGMPGMDAPEADAPMATGSDEMTSADEPAKVSVGSGTSWAPGAAGGMSGIHVMSGDWMFMTHGTFNLVADRQGGPRGGGKTFVSGMFMFSASRNIGESGGLTLRAMLSPEPFMGRSGYPSLLATGETADGINPLVDRQHPHDLFMELSAEIDWRFDWGSAFLYAGLPGEPAFGPGAFMHRASIMDSPEAPIGHHWLDSTHVTFGVVTAGIVIGDWKLEVSRFRGREPDENRFDIETGPLDSTSARLSWAPTPALVLQASWADVTSPEALEPALNQTRYSFSVMYAIHVFGRPWNGMAAWGRRDEDGHQLDSFTMEATVSPADNWTLFARAERLETAELDPGGTVYWVGKHSLGLIRDWQVADHWQLGVGLLGGQIFTPAGLHVRYDGAPLYGMVFLRVRIN